jgi:hypothetical protein
MGFLRVRDLGDRNDLGSGPLFQDVRRAAQTSPAGPNDQHVALNLGGQFESLILHFDNLQQFKKTLPAASGWDGFLN